MHRVSVAVALFTLFLAGIAWAADNPAHHLSGSVGFHNTAAPLGGRWWFAGQQVGIDVGLGFSSRPSETDPSHKVSGWAFDGGVPFIFHSWDRAHLILRPGILYQSQEAGVGAGPTFTTITPSQFALTGELEAEVFLADNISFSASDGIAFTSFHPDVPGEDSTTSFETIGHNFTEVGFHVYFFGSPR
jgi:hypothetical protein